MAKREKKVIITYSCHTLGGFKMKRITAAVSVLVMCLSLLCACGKTSEELGEWSLPEVASKPTAAPTAAPSYGAGSGEKYVWNEAVYFNMSDPGVYQEAVTKRLKHDSAMALFPYNFLPDVMLRESYNGYDRLRIMKEPHDTILAADTLGLAENAYIEIQYVPDSYDEKYSLTVRAELCGYESSRAIYEQLLYPHVAYADGAKPVESSYYLSRFVLAKYGTQRIAQIFKLIPKTYFSDVAAAMAESAESGEEYTPQRQLLLTISCGEKMSDENFIAAVVALLTYSDGSEIPVDSSNRLPVFGEKGAA